MVVHMCKNYNSISQINKYAGYHKICIHRRIIKLMLALISLDNETLN